MYEKFLEYCEYSPEEITAELPRVKKAFDRALLTEADVENANQRLVEFYEVDKLRGMRMVVGLMIKHFVDLVLSEDDHETRIYLHLPCMAGPLLGAAELAQSEIYVGYPDMLIEYVLGSFFNRMDPLLEASEELCLPPGIAHCGCNMAKLGARLTNVIPPASLHFSAGHYCDEAPKIDEVIQDYLGERVFWLNRCQDESFDDPLMDKRHLRYLANNWERARETMQEVIGTDIKDEHIIESIMTRYGFHEALNKLTDLIVKADPAPIHIGCIGLTEYMIHSSQGLKRRDEILEAVRVLQEDVKTRMERGEGVVEKGAPRVMLSMVIPLATPAMTKIMEDAGLNIACLEGYDEPTPEEKNVDFTKLAPIEIVPATYLVTPLMMKPTWRIDSIARGYINADLDGVIMLPHYSCRVFGNDYIIIRDGVKKELGNVPMVILETDLFDPRYYTAEQQRTRIESFAEMVKFAKASSN